MEVKTKLWISNFVNWGKGCEFLNWLRLKLEDEKQVGKNGGFIIGVWSGEFPMFLNRAYKLGILTKYDDTIQCVDELPLLKERKVIFVLPTLTEFKNQYVILNRDNTCDIFDKLFERSKELSKQFETYDNNHKLTDCGNRSECEFIFTSDCDCDIK